ncbi:hypothetical protein DSO57_1001608 [Entomophthora muscae]|uniref:Uncharacterized protein n=1 Tax=Entomophthora muscae TaxID=34485 RepID=A0ACC2RZS7_9FUNG|nr:hypothetical protein DSO57_1001608 [Entomophthora muscae]
MKKRCAGFPIHMNSAGHAIDLIIRNLGPKQRNRHEPHQCFLDERELDDIKRLAGLSEAQIKVWFNNARTRYKPKSL